AAGEETGEAFRATVASLEGSVAIAAAAADRPDRVLLALRGSGQALNVGLAEDTFVVASEPYGLVEETATHLRDDGQRPTAPTPGSSSTSVPNPSPRRSGPDWGTARCAVSS